MLINHKQVEVLTAVVFTLVFGLHLWRALTGWSMQFGPHQIPMYASWIAVVLIGFLAYSFWEKAWQN